MWFDHDDDFEENDVVMPSMNDPLKTSKYDAEFEQINIKFLERNKTGGTYMNQGIGKKARFGSQHPGL